MNERHPAVIGHSLADDVGATPIRFDIAPEFVAKAIEASPIVFAGESPDNASVFIEGSVSRSHGQEIVYTGAHLFFSKAKVGGEPFWRIALRVSPNLTFYCDTLPEEAWTALMSMAVARAKALGLSRESA